MNRKPAFILALNRVNLFKNKEKARILLDRLEFERKYHKKKFESPKLPHHIEVLILLLTIVLIVWGLAKFIQE